MKHNLMRHEIAGIILIVTGGTSMGLGLYYILSNAFRARSVFTPEILVFPVLFGIGLLLYEFGRIELKEVPPGKRR